MEDRRIVIEPKMLKIGEFYVQLSGRFRHMCMEIPVTYMAFFQPMWTNESPVIEVMMEEIEALEKENQRMKLVMEKQNYQTLQCYQGEDDFYAWVLWNHSNHIHGYPDFVCYIQNGWSRFHAFFKDATLFWEAFSILFAYAVLENKSMVLHGVAMEYREEGILLLGPSGIGKTTHARMWRDHERAIILNGDRCLCTKRVDGWYVYGMPWAGSSGEFANRCTKIKHLVFLEQGIENRVEPVYGFEASILLYKRVFAPEWEPSMLETAFNQCDDLVACCKCDRYKATIDQSSVDILEKYFYGKTKE